MKKETKEKWKESLLDALFELILGLICFAIGAGIFALFGKGIDDIDLELSILVGIGAITVVAIVISLIKKIIKKKKTPKENNGSAPSGIDDNSKQ